MVLECKINGTMNGNGKTVAVAATAPEFQLALVGVIVLLVLARRPAHRLPDPYPIRASNGPIGAPPHLTPAPPRRGGRRRRVRHRRRGAPDRGRLRDSARWHVEQLAARRRHKRDRETRRIGRQRRRRQLDRRRWVWVERAQDLFSWIEEGAHNRRETGDVCTVYWVTSLGVS